MVLGTSMTRRVTAVIEISNTTRHDTSSSSESNSPPNEPNRKSARKKSRVQANGNFPRANQLVSVAFVTSSRVLISSRAFSLRVRSREIPSVVDRFNTNGHDYEDMSAFVTIIASREPHAPRNKKGLLRRPSRNNTHSRTVNYPL